MLNKLESFARAAWSFIRYGDESLNVATVREMTCYQCPELVTTRTNYFCGKCDCPHSFVSDLRTKWRMPGASCPLGKW